MKDHKYADVITNYIIIDNYAYRAFDRGNYWGYTFEGLIRFPDSGEWEFGTYSDNAMTVVFDGERLHENRPSSWDRTIRPMQESVRVVKGKLYPIKVSMLEMTGGEVFFFAVRKKGETQWRQDLTGLVYHK